MRFLTTFFILNLFCITSVFANESKFDSAKFVFQKIHTIKQLEALSTILFPEAKDRDYIKSVTKTVPPNTAFQFSQEKDLVEVRVGAQHLKMTLLNQGAVTVKGHIVKLPATGLRELTEEIQKADQSKNVAHVHLPLRFLAASDEAHAVLPFVALYLAGALYTASKCFSLDETLSAYHVKAVDFADVKKRCGIAAVLWPFALPILFDSQGDRSAHVTCPMDPNGRMDIQIQNDKGATRRSSTTVEKGHAVNIKYMRGDYAQPITYFLNDKGEVTSTKPDAEVLAENVKLHLEILKQCYQDKGKIAEFEQLLDLKSVEVDGATQTSEATH